MDDVAAEVGRANVPWLHGYQTWVGVDPSNHSQAKDAVAKGMERFYKIPFSAFERYTPVGTPKEIAEKLLEYVDAGAALFNLKVCTRSPEEEVALAGEIVAEMKKG